jgi:hypothetical protein
LIVDVLLDFTEAGYEALLREASRRFRFADFSDLTGNEGECIWRHDVDMSPHRAVRLAEIEKNAGVRAHYFIMFGSRFYNPFEPGVTHVLKRLAGMGHGIGLHFDPSAIPFPNDSGCVQEALRKQADMLSFVLEASVDSFSLHNPMAAQAVGLTTEKYGNLLNVSAPTLVNSFSYCSDSNGIWRHCRLIDVVRDSSVCRLYALTHPEWWVPSAMRPRERIQRCIDGRAACAGREYDEDLVRFGRPNR